jgi:Zn-dependent M28 family amino/carboxypeptidase
MPCRSSNVRRAALSTLLLFACSSKAAPEVLASTTDAGSDAGPPRCGQASSVNVGACVERSRYEADLDFVTGARTPMSAHWMEVQDRCASTLEAAGFSTSRVAFDMGVNVVGVKAGTGANAEHRVLIGAHYDSVPGCNGADDNASGIAGVLEAARVLGPLSLDRTLVLACFDREEDGLLGSIAFVQGERDAQHAYDVAFVFETMAYRSDEPNTQMVPDGLDALFPQQVGAVRANESRGDFIALVGDESAMPFLASLARYGAQDFQLPSQIFAVPAALKTNTLLGDLQRSDHAPFWFADVPAMMITDTANFRNAGYHCYDAPDDLDRLDVDFAARVTAATVAAAAEALGVPATP